MTFAKRVRYDDGDPLIVDGMLSLVDVNYYSNQAAVDFADPTTALRHYLDSGFSDGLNPHPLFDTEYYLKQNAGLRESDINPLAHFVQHGSAQKRDPSPYFDSEYYCSQSPQLRAFNVNALLHYLEHAPSKKVANPNPLFGNGYYSALYGDDLLPGESPLAHYVRIGFRERRFASKVQQDLLSAVPPWSRRPLARGGRRAASALFFLRGGRDREIALAAAEVLHRERSIAPVTVLIERADAIHHLDRLGSAIVLQEYEDRCDVLRPSALRLLARALSATHPLFSVTNVPDFLEGAGTADFPSYLLVLDTTAVDPGEAMRIYSEAATRVVFGSRDLIRQAMKETGSYPPNVTLRHYPRTGAQSNGKAPTGDQGVPDFVRSLMDLAARDLRSTTPAIRSPRRRRPKVLVPASDWSVSGVNAALEAVGTQLLRRGWDLELIFTREREWVLQTAGRANQMPAVPYRFLGAPRGGVEGMWEALIDEVQRHAPCILFTAYDFVANGVVPALTDDVGVVMWLQADDGDYYEQAYRLGRYCNAVVCVSSHIKDSVSALHPGIGERARMIHNASVSASDVAGASAAPADQLKIVYTGRLVQYQKRILDFVDLADALDKKAVPYTITLIGTFNPHDEATARFPREAARHIEKGTIRLLGRLAREEVLEELRRHHIFVLLSDFEGLPLALLEGMAAGCVPVVGQMESGIDEVVTGGENGLIVAGRDYGTWADALVNLWNDRQRLSRMSESARVTVRDGFTVEGAATQFEVLFSQVAEEVDAGGFTRPPSLNWGPRRSRTGDVLPPPSLYRPVKVPGLG